MVNKERCKSSNVTVDNRFYIANSYAEWSDVARIDSRRIDNRFLGEILFLSKIVIMKARSVKNRGFINLYNLSDREVSNIRL